MIFHSNSKIQISRLSLSFFFFFFNFLQKLQIQITKFYWFPLSDSTFVSFSTLSSRLSFRITGNKSSSSSSDSLKEPFSSDDFLWRFRGELIAFALSFFLSLCCFGTNTFSAGGDSDLCIGIKHLGVFPVTCISRAHSCKSDATGAVAWCIWSLLGFFTGADAVFFSLCFTFSRWNKQKSVINHVQITSIVNPTMMLTRRYLSRSKTERKKI